MNVIQISTFLPKDIAQILSAQIQILVKLLSDNAEWPITEAMSFLLMLQFGIYQPLHRWSQRKENACYCRYNKKFWKELICLLSLHYLTMLYE
jgi:hypothetical protein